MFHSSYLHVLFLFYELLFININLETIQTASLIINKLPACHENVFANIYIAEMLSSYSSDIFWYSDILLHPSFILRIIRLNHNFVFSKFHCSDFIFRISHKDWCLFSLKWNNLLIFFSPSYIVFLIF